jgi:hypothetical protein
MTGIGPVEIVSRKIFTRPKAYGLIFFMPPATWRRRGIAAAGSD